MGLDILRAELIGSESMSIGVSQISHNAARETITVHANRTIDAQEKLLLKVAP